MESDRVRWNEKHAAKACTGDPDSFFLKYFHLLRPGQTLDLACGRGRHTIYLASKGHQVTAVDISDVALQAVQQRASSKGLLVSLLRIDLDLSPWPFAPQGFQNVVCINFRPPDALLKALPSWLKPGGHFIWCSFNELQSAITGFPAELALHYQAFMNLSGLHNLIYERFEDQTGLRDGYVFVKP